MLVFSRRRLAALAATATATVLLLLWLPYRIPVQPSLSESYIFGFNNHAGIAIIALGALLSALIAWRAPLQPYTGPTEQPLPKSALHQALAATLLVNLCLYLLTRRLDGFNESIYLVDRIKLLLEGKVIYRDFEFAYGPLMLYGPVWLCRLHLPVGDAYNLFWIAANLTGVWMAFKTLQWIDAPAPGRRLLFVLLVCLSLLAATSTGLNYSLIRYILPCFLGLDLYRRLAPINRPRTQPPVILLALPYSLAIFLVSPEVALSFVLGISVYLLLYGHLRLIPNLLAYLAALSGIGIAIHLAQQAGYFYTMNAFRTGGLNFPIIPGPHILLFLLALGFSSIYAASQIRRRHPSGLLMLLAVSAAGVVGALSRCDQIHTFMNPLGLTIASIAIANQYRSFGKAFRYATLAVYLVIPTLIGAPALATSFSRAALPSLFAWEGNRTGTALDRIVFRRMERSLGPTLARIKFDNYKTFATGHLPADLSPLYGYPAGTQFLAPFGFTPSRFGTAHTPQIDEGYFLEDINLINDASVQRKVAEIAAHPERPLLILPGREGSCVRFGDRAMIRSLFLVPYNRPAQHVGETLNPLCNYILNNYELKLPDTPMRYGYAVWQRRTPPPA
jgi:hypothetical protein